MMMRFKKVYIEITNVCNLRCSFCIGNSRKSKFMNIDEFSIILDKISGYTKYLYFHILGEPLMHPNIVDFINLANEKGFFVNITTNGYLIDKLKGVKGIRQLNISLHSFNPINGVSVGDYLNSIFSTIDSFSNTFVSLRFWVGTNDDILNGIVKHYNIDSLPLDFDKFKVSDNVFLSKSNEFIWPDLNNNYYNRVGKCYGLIHHIGILSDGSVVPCCLDSKGIINLGNIFSDSLLDILNSDRVSKMINGFRCSKKVEELCCHCVFLDK